MKAADTSDDAVLKVLARRPGEWHTLDGHGIMPDIGSAFAEGTPPKVKLAKMKSLIKRGLVDGCACGCRGDFEITDKGKALLNPPAKETPHA